MKLCLFTTQNVSLFSYMMLSLPTKCDQILTTEDVPVMFTLKNHVPLDIIEIHYIKPTFLCISISDVG